ncbi:MAG: asparaginase domain-containing protein [Rubrivivax sp.]
MVVIGTGGTIAGVAARADDQAGYRAGELDAATLVAAVPPLGEPARRSRDVLARLDSCDMDHATWWRCVAPRGGAGARRCRRRGGHARYRHARGDGVLPAPHSRR